MRITPKMAAIAVATLVLPCSAPAAAALVVNGSFETGDFTGWTRSGALALSGVNTALPNSGDFAAFFSPNRNGTITQVIPTFAGKTYRIKFFLAHEGPGQAVPINSFAYSFGGVEVGNFADFGLLNYGPITFNRVGTGAPMALTFTFRDVRPTRFFIDDISVVRLARVGNVLTPLPEPATWVSLLFGFALTGLVLRRRQPRTVSA